MGCFSFICQGCNTGINSSSFEGERCILFLLKEGKVIQKMEGDYGVEIKENYRVAWDEGNNDFAITGLNGHSVFTHYDGTKMRVCKFEVIQECTKEREEVVYGQPAKSESSGDDGSEECEQCDADDTCTDPECTGYDGVTAEDLCKADGCTEHEDDCEDHCRGCGEDREPFANFCGQCGEEFLKGDNMNSKDENQGLFEPLALIVFELIAIVYRYFVVAKLWNYVAVDMFGLEPIGLWKAFALSYFIEFISTDFRKDEELDSNEAKSILLRTFFGITIAWFLGYLLFG